MQYRGFRPEALNIIGTMGEDFQLTFSVLSFLIHSKNSLKAALELVKEEKSRLERD